MIGQFLTA